MLRKKILVVEDCDNYRIMLTEVLSAQYEVDAVSSAEAALSLIQKDSYHLALVDIGLPKMDGYKFCTAVRAIESAKNMTVVFLSGNTAVEDKLVGFSVGAVDYIQKPVDRRELIARIKAHLEAKDHGPSSNDQLEVGGLRAVLPSQRASYMAVDGSRVEMQLTPIEFRLLCYFLTHIDHVVTRSHLLDRVWTDARQVSDRNVDVTVSKLRTKMGPFGNCLKTVWGEGYRFSSPQIKAG